MLIKKNQKQNRSPHLLFCPSPRNLPHHCQDHLLNCKSDYNPPDLKASSYCSQSGPPNISEQAPPIYVCIYLNYIQVGY